MLKYLPLLAFVLLAAGCASVPPSSQYLSRINRESAPPVTSVALLDTPPMLAAGVNKATIDPGDKIVRIDKYNSYYKIFKIPAAQGNLHLTLDSYCSCLSFDKRIMVPVMIILSSDGAVTKPAQYQHYLHQASGLNSPLHISLDADVPAAAAGYVLIAADNSQPDATIQRLLFRSAMSSDELDVRSYPIGHFELTYK